MKVSNQQLLERIGKFPGLFVLQPVITSSGFIPADQSRGLLGDPVILAGLADEFKHEINFEQIDAIVGIDLSGVTLATAISFATQKPLVIAREKPKREGRPALVGGDDYLRPGSRVLLVDDLIALGKTKIERI